MPDVADSNKASLTVPSPYSDVPAPESEPSSGDGAAASDPLQPRSSDAEASGSSKDENDVEYWRTQLREHLDDTGRSMSAAARGMGRSASAVSQYLSGTYRGDNEAVARDVRSYLSREEERNRRRREGSLITGYGTLVKTQAYQRLHQIARICHVERDVGVLVAEAGTGKTVAAEAYAEEHPDVILVQVDPGFTAKATMQEVARALGLRERGTLYAITRRVYGRLKGSGRLLIVDEAESLPTRALELLRRVHDKTGCGLLLVGLERLMHNLRGSQGEFKQLWSRVGVKAKLPEELSSEDTRQLVSATLPGENMDALTEAVREVTTGARTTAKLLRRAASVAKMNGRDVTPAVIDKARQLLIL